MPQINIDRLYQPFLNGWFTIVFPAFLGILLYEWSKFDDSIQGPSIDEVDFFEILLVLKKTL